MIELIERVIDPNKGMSQKAIYDAFVKFCDDELIDSVAILFGYVDQAKPDEEWWKVIQPVNGLGPDNRLAWSKVKEVWRASKQMMEQKKDTVLTKEELLWAALFPEEWWLQAWARNREPKLNLSRLTAQLCRRHDAHDEGALVPEYRLAEYEAALRQESAGCTPGAGGHSLRSLAFAWKRFPRYASHPVSARALRLRPGDQVPGCR